MDIEQEAGFYHFLYATVNSEYEGERGIAKLNGFTEITGGQIKTDKITSGNGQQYIHLFDDHIEIKANLKITDGNKTEIKQLVSPDLLSLENRLKQYSNENNAKGEIYLRGTGLNRHAAPIIQINGQNIVPDNYRGLYLAVIRRSDLQVMFQQSYDTFGTPIIARKELTDKLNSLNSDVLVALVSRDSAFQNSTIAGTDELKNALIRCGTNDDNSKFISRMPYAFLGIPNIGKGNGIEVYTANTDIAPYAEIATKIINGTPQGMNSVFNGMLQTAKNATEAYARAQAELTKTQAIAAADGKITEAEQRQIQQLQLKLQEAKTFAEQKVNELNIGGRNLFKNSGVIVSNNKYNIASYQVTENIKLGETVTLTIDGDFADGCWPLLIAGGGNGNYGSLQRGVNVWKNNLNLDFKKGDSFSVFIVGNGNSTKTNTIRKIKLERGNKPTDWSPAPEDVWDTMVDLGIIDKNAMNLTEAEKANVKFINGMFRKGADYTNGTEVVKNTITTGALTVAGINGAGLSGESIRFFAGANYRDKERAPFRVQDDGSIYASKGQIGNFKIESASETSLKANGLTIASEGLIRAMGRGKDSRTTQVRINDPEIFKTVDKSAIDVYTSGFGDTTHSAMKLESRGGRKSTALILKAIWGKEESVALDVLEGDIKVKGLKGYTGYHHIDGHAITITNGIITNVTLL